MDHPATGTYYNEELNIGIAFGVDEYCPVLLLPDGSSYILGVSTTGRFECWEFEFVAQFTWQPGDNFISIKIVKYAGDYTPDKWYVLTPRG